MLDTRFFSLSLLKAAGLSRQARLEGVHDPRQLCDFFGCSQGAGRARHKDSRVPSADRRGIARCCHRSGSCPGRLARIVGQVTVRSSLWLGSPCDGSRGGMGHTLAALLSSRPRSQRLCKRPALERRRRVVLQRYALQVDQGGSLLVELFFQLALVAVVRVELVLKGHNLVVTLVEPLSEKDHDVPLLQQQLLVPVHLSFFFFHGLALLLKLMQLGVVLGADFLLVLLQGVAEGRGIRDSFSPSQHLALQGADASFKSLLLFLLPKELSAASFQSANGGHFVQLGSPALLVQLQQPALVHNIAGSLLQLGAEAAELALIPPQQRFLVQVFVHPSFIFDVLRSVGKLER
mmetsp:Transcript_1429/g.5627  ORF Transcript_1429/g.5627 Transcript_1429/m.5627 type:complete len:348 (-) Transcript_1429:1292-2335(-)